MKIEPRRPDLDGLFKEWLIRRQKGNPSTPEELCRDCPELLDALKQRAAAAQENNEPLATPAQSDTGLLAAAKLSLGDRPALPDLATQSKFHNLRFHAKGGLGEVWIAEDETLSRLVALKLIQSQHCHREDALARFRREAEITSCLEHAGVVPVHSIGNAVDGRPCYAMRYIEGQTLHEAIREFHNSKEDFTSLGFRQLLRHFVDVCNTVAYAHSRGIIHRDLKPANIMLGEFGETWVLDWGLAKNLFAMLDGESSSPTDVSQHDPAQLTTPGGTPGFVAPEQIDGRAGNANDIYALGAILYSLLTGQGPVSDRLKDEWLQRTRDGNYPRPRELNRAIPRALEAICLKARAVKPEDRYATARELSQEVERWFGDEPTKTWLEPFPVRAARWGRRHRTLVVTTSVAAFLFVSLTGAGGWWYQLHRTRQRLAVEQRGQLIEEDLKQGEQALREEDLVRAKQHLERAGGRIDVGAAEPLRKRRAELLEQLEFVGQLERLRERCLVFDGSNQRILPVGTEYMEVFQRHGMRFGDLNPFARSVFGLYSPDFALGDLSDRNSL